MLMMRMNSNTDAGRGLCGVPANYIKRKNFWGIKSSSSFQVGPSLEFPVLFCASTLTSIERNSKFR
jgi:hypothetical protein